MEEHADIVQRGGPESPLGDHEFRENGLDDFFESGQLRFGQPCASNLPFFAENVDRRTVSPAGIENCLGLNHQDIGLTVSFLEDLPKFQNTASAAGIEKDYLPIL